MNARKMFVFLLAAVLMTVSFGAGRASASTGCFSDSVGHWAETFICFLKDNGITSGFPDGTYKPENGVTRAEMAVFLQKSIELANATSKSYADSLVNVPPAVGDVLVSAGYSNWIAIFSTDPISYLYSSNRVDVTSSA